MRQYEDSLPSFNTAIQLDPDNVSYHNDKARALLGLNLPHSALQSLDNSIKVGGNFAEV